MALLLALYQKLRLTREKNQLTLKLTQYTHKCDRIQKNIEKVQKMYTSKEANLDKYAKMLENNGKMFFAQKFGITSSSLYPGSQLGNAYGLNSLTASDAQAYWNKVIEDNPSYPSFQDMYNTYLTNPNFKEAGSDNYVSVGTKQLNDDMIRAFHAAIVWGQQCASNRSIQQQTLSADYSNSVSIWLEAAKEELEEEQNEALAPLNYEDTMMELEKEQTETRLERVKAELETYTQLCSEEAKNSAPKFGLG